MTMSCKNLAIAQDDTKSASENEYSAGSSVGEKRGSVEGRL